MAAKAPGRVGFRLANPAQGQSDTLQGAVQCWARVRTSLRASRGSGCSLVTRASWYRAWSA